MINYLFGLISINYLFGFNIKDNGIRYYNFDIVPCFELYILLLLLTPYFVYLDLRAGPKKSKKKNHFISIGLRASKTMWSDLFERGSTQSALFS